MADTFVVLDAPSAVFVGPFMPTPARIAPFLSRSCALEEFQRSVLGCSEKEA